MNPISRRQFLKLVGVAGLAASLGGCGLFRTQRPWIEQCPKPGMAEETVPDYIVIGSGAGGGPLAANLARAGYTVLLMEAGGEHENENYTVPAFHPFATEDKEMQWNYFVKHYTSEENQRRDTKFYEGRQGKGIWYPRAGTLGGCTAHNAMITVYPHPSDWDYIASLTGDNSWKAEEMRKYFQRVENCQYLGQLAKLFNLGEHGFHGWLPVSRLDKNLGFLDRVLDPDKVAVDPQLVNILAAAGFTTLEDLGEKKFQRVARKVYALLLGTKDVNDVRSIANRPDGIYLPGLAINKGRRASPREYIRETQKHCANQLMIKTNVLVTRILFGKDNTAIGVEYREGKNLYRADPKADQSSFSASEPQRTIKAKREIILSAGTFNTPQLLMLSGVGPREELEKHNIPVVYDLPGVGKNLQDRYEVGVVSELKEELATLKDATFKAQESDPNYQEWKEKGTGLYATNGVVMAVQKKSRLARKKGEDPDLYIFGLPGVFKGYEPGYTNALRIPEEYQTKKLFTWLILKAHTKNSGGEVTLRSNDPRDVPEINFKYFHEGNDPNKGQEDLDAVAEGVEFVRKIMRSERTTPIVKREAWPGEEIKDEQIKEWIKNEAWGHHASCTCKIGSDDDRMAVLDNNFRVRGTKNLRIVDASVFPKIPGFFIVTSIYMISEKATDVILGDAQSA